MTMRHAARWGAVSVKSTPRESVGKVRAERQSRERAAEQNREAESAAEKNITKLQKNACFFPSPML